MKIKLFIALALLSFSFLLAQTSQSYIEQAKGFLERGFYPQAEGLMEEAIAQSPDNYENYLIMFKVQMAKGDLQTAYQNLDYYVNNAKGIDYDYYDNLLKLIEDSVIRISKGIRQYQIGYYPQYLNSEYSDFAPIVSPDGKYLYYTSARNCKALKENIFVSEKLGGNWGKPQSVKSLLTDNNESMDSFSKDGNYVYLFGHYDGTGNSGIYRATKVRTAFTTPEKIEAVSSDYNDLQPFVYEDQVMFFTSNRPGSMGGYDIWVSEYSNGWQEPVNLGGTINTINDEETPFISWDGQTLYFASNGHSSFGGLDIFRAKKSGNSWTDWEAPINLGPEINTINNERHYYRVNNSNEAYISSDRLNGKGGEDVYKVVILNEEYIDGIRVYGEVVDNYGKPVSVDINWKYTSNEEEKVTVIQTNDNGYYNLYLPKVDSVFVEITKPNCQTYTNSITFEEGATELNYNIEILLLEEKNYVIENIYFDFDKATLKEESFVSLDNLASTLLLATDINVCIIGYTDNVGSAKYNQGLSERRAKAVYEYLRKKDVDETILNYRGEGQENPKVPNDTEENRQLNRRVEFNITRDHNTLLEDKSEATPMIEDEVRMKDVVEIEDSASMPKDTEQEVQLEELSAKVKANSTKLEKLLVESDNVNAPEVVEAKPLDSSDYMSDVEIAMINNISEKSNAPFLSASDVNIIKNKIIRIAEEYKIINPMQVVLENKDNKINVAGIKFVNDMHNDSFDQEVKSLLNGWFIPGVTAENYILVIDPLEEK